MNYRSIADLSHAIRENMYKLPPDIDLVVGVPRSGMLPANMIALFRNLKLTDLAGYLADTPLKTGRTRKSLFADVLKPSDANHVLVIDDSIDSGESLNNTKVSIEKNKKKQTITYCVIYSTIQSIKKIDVFFEIVPQPRIFEWNLMHRPFLAKCCLDIDGVLCLDPTSDENDDGSSYINFIKNVSPLVVPSYPIGHLVTSRLEKYRVETERWLKNHGFVFDHLHMLDLPDAKTRRRLNCHASFKAKIFKNLKETELFIESDPGQSANIANISGKPVLCARTQKMFYPGISCALAERKAFIFARRVSSKLARIVRRVSNL